MPTLEKRESSPAKERGFFVSLPYDINEISRVNSGIIPIRSIGTKSLSINTE